MRNRLVWPSALLLFVAMSSPTSAGIGISFGFVAPIGPPPPPMMYFRPNPYLVPHPYYSPPPPYYYYAQPAPVMVTPVPVVIEARTQPAPVPVSRPPVENLPPAIAQTNYTPTQPAVRESESLLANLFHPEERTRMESASRLGQQRADAAVDALNRALASDPAPSVRDASARALGLIGKPGALAALRAAATNDTDPEVRRSAAYSVEVILSQLRAR